MTWEEARPIVRDVLLNCNHYRSDKLDEPCFLTAYQIAVLARGQGLQDPLQIGGEGIGEHSSLAQQIARMLSSDSQNFIRIGEEYNGMRIEMRFLSTQGLNTVKFDEETVDGGRKPSVDEFSMFRLKAVEN